MGKWFAIALMLVSISSMQLGGALAKTLFPVLGASGVCFMRIAVAFIILSAVFKPWRHKPNAAQLKKIIAYGAALGLMNLTYYFSLELLPIGIAVSLEFIGPIAVTLFYSRRPLDLLWAVLVIAGIALVVPHKNSASDLSVTGIAFALAAGAAWAFYIVFGKRASSGGHSGTNTTLGMLAALVTVSPVVVPSLRVEAFTNVGVVVSAIGVGVLASALPYSLEMIALKHLPAKNFGILLSLSPAAAAISGYLVLHEALSLQQLIAIGCILAASLGSAVFMKQDTPAPIEV